MGIPGLGASFASGGTQTPLHIAALGRVPFAVANIGLAGGYATMTEAAMRMLSNYTNIKNRDTLIHDMGQGLAHGAVCLAENHSHSSVSDVRYSCVHRQLKSTATVISLIAIRCRAEFDYDDRVYKIKGTKTCVYGGANSFEGNTVRVTAR